MAVVPASLLGSIMYHVGGAMPHLRSWNREGPTLYALTIVGARGGSRGGASIVGPALDSRGLTAAWPAAARRVCEKLFSKPSARRAGQITVFVIVQVGNTTHCTPIVIPSTRAVAPPRGTLRLCSVEAGPLA